MLDFPVDAQDVQRSRALRAAAPALGPAAPVKDASAVFYVFNGAATTYGEFDRLVARRARRFAPWRGGVIALWLDHDPNYLINLFAVWAVGATPLLVSRRLPAATVLALTALGKARALVASAPVGPCPVPILAPAGDRGGPEHAPAADIGCPTQEVALILHTSGTTNLPKLVPFTLANLRASLALQLARWGGAWTNRDATLGALPLFHAFGLTCELLCGYRLGSRYHFCNPNPNDMLARLRQERGRITHLFTVPWMVQQLLDAPSGLAALKGLRFLIVGGAPLGQDVGDRLTAEGVRVVLNYGMSEIGCAFMGPVGGGDWRDLFPVIPARFWHVEEGTNKLFIHADCPTLSPAHRKDFCTEDVLARFPSGGHRHQGRQDDVLVHANGEKSNALVIEQMLLSRLRARVELAVFLGAGRLRPACVLQLKYAPAADDRPAVDAALDRINAELPQHSRLGRDMVLLLAPDGKRLPVTAKGTVMRKKAELEFKDELDRLYSGAAAAGATLESFFDRPGAFDRRVSLFDQGLDSLSAVALGHHVARLAPNRRVPPNIVYQHPTLEQLERYLRGEEAAPERVPPTFPEFGPADHAAARFEYEPPRHVLLTGASGFIGAELVEALARLDHVERISCLVRGHAPRPNRSNKVRYYAGYSMTDPGLGLSVGDYADLAAKADAVVHAAWPIDFNAPYARMADAALPSVRHLIEFARRGDKCLHFFSSIATVMLHPTKRRVDEEWPASDCRACLPHGYAQTKWEAEHLILRSGVRHKVYRLGQISAHRTTLRWNANEHIPILLDASRTLGGVPVLPLPVDWTPVDVACRAVVELMTVAGVNLHHVANPRPRPPECLAAGSRPVPLAQWMAEAEPQLARLPRLAALWPFLSEILALFDRIRPLDADATAAHSPALAACESISDDYIIKIRNLSH